MKIENSQLVSLNIEFKTAAKLIRLGLAELQQISFTNHDIYLACLLLTSGYERLTKGIICLKYLRDHNKFPSFEVVKKYGHNLVKLKEYIMNNCISKTKALKTPHTKEDYDFLSSDEELDIIIQILSDFAQKGRYHNLDLCFRILIEWDLYQYTLGFCTSSIEVSRENYL